MFCPVIQRAPRVILSAPRVILSAAKDLLLLATLPALLAAQDAPTGRISGRVIDAETGRGITDAGVQVVGTTLGTSSGLDGRFTLAAVPAGTITIQVRRLGYQPKTVTGLILDAGAALEQVISLSTTVTQVEAVTVSAAAERGSVEAALDEQRNAAQVVSAVTSEQISRSPDANAAQAVQRVSGVTLQDGKYVQARGLGERYTTTSLNGARVPSPEPERKMVPLDLFPSGLLQSVTLSKTFTPDLPGDFSGAHVDIRTREFPADRQATYGVSLGYGDGTLGKQLRYAPGVGGELFAMAGAERALPSSVRSVDVASITRPQSNAIINSFRDVWRAGLRSSSPNTAGRVSVGGNDAIFGHRVGYLLSGTYSYSQDARDASSRAIVGPAGAGINKYSGPSSGESVLWGGLLNASTMAGRNTRVALNGMYNRSADNDARVERGTDFDLGVVTERQQLRYVERAVGSGQLTVSHQTGAHALDLSATGSAVARNEPDRSELSYIVEPQPGGGERLLWDFSGNGATRTFSELDDKAFEVRGTYRFEFGRGGRSNIKVGGLGRGARRVSDVQAFAISSTGLPDSLRALPPEEIFGGRFTGPDSTVLLLRPLAQGGSYTANDAIHAGFGMIEVPLTDAVWVIAGARVEQQDVSVRTASTLGTPSRVRRTFSDVLPSLALTYRPVAGHTVRLSVSRTLARPEYREMSDVATVDPNNPDNIQRGNPQLVRTRIANADARYEFYPRRGEVLSAAVFAKRFEKPIERVYTATTGKPVITWVNADAANNYGVELEARKDLDQVAEILAPLTVFSSVTLMRSTIDLGTTASTNANRAMVGQSPYVVNAGLTYSSANRAASATLLYNRVGPRVWEAGLTPFPDARELARDAVDLSLRWPMRGGLNARFDAKNLMDAPHEIRQGTVAREYYRVGRTFQFGFNVQR